MLTFKQLPSLTSGKILAFYQDYSIQHLLLDTRKIIFSEYSLFFAIKGARHDGHHFLEDAYHQGVRQFIIEHENSMDVGKYPLANILLVDSTVDALQCIAAHRRKQFHLPVMAITGSNGKTIVKEWLAQLLMKDFYIAKSPKSYNSQVGVPLSVWELNERHEFGLFEAGISTTGEMGHLEKVIQPTLGLFTNIGEAHNEGFINTAQKIREKLQLFTHVKLLFYCKDHWEIDQVIAAGGFSFSTFTWSRHHKNADVYIRKTEEIFDQTKIHLSYKQEKIIFLCDFKDEASIENVLHCISFLLFQEVPLDEIQKRLFLLQKVAMRLELKQGINGCYIIDDTYNNDLSGISMALHFLAQQHQHGSKTVVLSDVLEGGKSEEEIYASIAQMLRENGVQKFIGIGPALQSQARYFKDATFFTSTEDFIHGFDPKEYNKETILIKGARKFHFEKIVNLMVQKVHGTMLHINLDALAHNLNYYRSLLKPATKIMVMVKAFAYGSGSYEVANLLQYHRVDYLGVAYADEGVALRQHGVKLPIMVMNPSVESFAKLLEFHLEPEIYSFRILQELQEFLKDLKGSVPCHIKIDTGMKRLGFELEEVEKLVVTLRNSPLRVASIFTHLAGADEARHNDFSKLQLNTFRMSAEKIEQGLGYACIKHGLNSAGILRFPENQMDMVRLGIGLYGIETNKIKQDQLQVVGTLKTIISQIKKVRAGETVGYSRNGAMPYDATIATIAIGYADGYNRRFGHGVGKIWVNGTKCPTVGSVCMDMTMIDITHATASEGDEVVIFGKEVSVSALAADIGTIPYEILTGVNERVRRIFFAE